VLTVLDRLSRLEQAVALAWSHPRTASWTEAAADALALGGSVHPGSRRCVGLDAQALGERVRRKLKRLGDRARRPPCFCQGPNAAVRRSRPRRGGPPGGGGLLRQGPLGGVSADHGDPTERPEG